MSNLIEKLSTLDLSSLRTQREALAELKAKVAEAERVLVEFRLAVKARMEEWDEVVRDAPKQNLRLVPAPGREGSGFRQAWKVPTGDFVPVIPNLDARILAKVKASGECALRMDNWHTDPSKAGSKTEQSVSDGWCGTAHCMAGWAIHLAGVDGYALEALTDAEAAGAAIFYASTGSVPDFYANNEEAIAQLKERVLAAALAKVTAGEG